MPRCALAALAAFALPAVVHAQRASHQGPVAEEWRVRAVALERVPFEVPSEHSAWHERYLALEGLRRRLPGALGEAGRDFARASLASPHPSVREAALLVHAVHGVAPAGDLEVLVREPLAGTRRALARALAHRPGEEVDAALLSLCADGDPEVAAEARAQLLGRGPASASAQLELLRSLTDGGLFLDALQALELGPRNTVVLGRLDEWLRDRAGEQDARARRALLHTVLGSPELEVLAAGWTAQLAEASPRARREQRERLELLAVALGEDGPRLARLLLERMEAERAAARAGDDAAAGRAALLLRGAVLAHHPARPDAVEPFPVDPDWEPELAREFWTAVAGRAARFGEEARSGLEHEDPELRALALEAVLDAWRLGGDPGTGALLLERLEDPELGDGVYGDLMGARRAPPDPTRLHRAWRQRPLSRRVALLETHLAGRPTPAWREDLLELWGSGAGRTAAVVERLGDLRRDPAVLEALRGWIDQELEVLEASAEPAEEVVRGPWRDAESRAQALVRAWIRARDADDPVEEVELLLRAGRLGREVGKTIVALLAPREAGRERLLAALEREELSRRLRLEIVLLCEGAEDTASFLELFEAYEELDGELRLRALRRAAGTDAPAVRERLSSVALDRRASGVLRLAAVESLASAGSPAEVAARLAAVLRGTDDPELRRAAIAALGELGGGAAAELLLQLAAEGITSDGTGEALLIALARSEARHPTPEGTARLVAEWRALALGRREEELRRRFLGERLPAREFAYRGWLEAAEVMAGAGTLRAALGEEAWTLDGRLLERLARTVREAGASGAGSLARELERAALVALEGEGEAKDLDAARVRVRARLLEAALEAGESELAARLARAQLDGLLSGRVSALAVRSTYGVRDPAAGRDPLGRLARLARAGASDSSRR